MILVFKVLKKVDCSRFFLPLLILFSFFLKCIITLEVVVALTDGCRK